MPSLRNYLENTGRSASATGLTGLDQTATAFSWGAWLWVSRNLALGRSTLWGHADNQASPKNGILVFANQDGGIRLGVQTAANNSFDSVAGIVPHRSWCHVGVMYNGSRYFTYRNGVLVSSVACSTTPTVSGTRTTQIGWNVSSSTSLRSSRLWDIRVFPALSLSHGEMVALADPRSILRGCEQRLCYQRNWRVQGSGAVTLFDESGNGNNLTTSATTLEADTDAEPDWYGVLRGRRVFGRAPAATGITGASSATLAFGSTSATGTVLVQGASTSALAFGGTLTGTVLVQGASSVTLAITGSATGGAGVQGASTATFALAGSATGTVLVRGASSLTLALTGSATGLSGSVVVRGLVRSVLTWTAAVRADLTHTSAVRADLTNTPAASADLTVTPAVRVDITHDTDD